MNIDVIQDLLIWTIPFIMVVVCVLSCVIAHFKYRKRLKEVRGYIDNLLWSCLTCMMGLLVICLNIISRNEEGFVTPIVMGLILLVFFYCMTLLPITTLHEGDNSRG